MLNLQERFNNKLDSAGYFEKKPKIAIALSGGADSTALLLLAHEWSIKAGGTVVALTVDHQLRAASKAEAQQAKELSSSLDIAHHTLLWTDPQLHGNIQARAREARYKLLTDYCRRHDIIHLLIGHHLEDRVENFFIRIFRGSGVLGLAESDISYISNIRILRPLADFNKEDLKSYLRGKNVPWCEDESNRSYKYLRTNIRQLLTTFHGFSHKLSWRAFNLRLNSVQQNISYAYLATRDNLLKALVNCIKLGTYGNITLNWSLFWHEDAETQLPLLAYILTQIGGQHALPRMSAVRQLVDALSAHSTIYRNIHGCYVLKEQQIIHICRDFGRIAPQDIKWCGDNLWDNRFRVQGSKLPKLDLSIGYLTEQDYQELKPSLDISPIRSMGRIYRKLLFTLPVIKCLEKVVCIPHINYHRQEYDTKSWDITLSLHPSFISKLTHF